MNKQFKQKLKRLKALCDKQFEFLTECQDEYFEIYGKSPDGDCWVDTFTGGGSNELNFNDLEDEALGK